MLWREPRHPYTRALLNSVPAMDPAKKIDKTLAGEIGGEIATKGCRFRNRCPIAEARCAEVTPELRKLPDGNAVACHLA